jgi:hypothetical protein
MGIESRKEETEIQGGPKDIGTPRLGLPKLRSNLQPSRSQGGEGETEAQEAVASTRLCSQTTVTVAFPPLAVTVLPSPFPVLGTLSLLYAPKTAHRSQVSHHTTQPTDGARSWKRS